MLVDDNQVRVEKLFRFRAPELFQALAKGRLFFNCSGDYETFENDFRVGGRYRFPTEKGSIEGTFEVIEPNERLVFTWDRSCEGPIPGGTRVELRFADAEGGSRLELIHSGLSTEKLVTSHREGWNYLVNRLPEKVQG